MFSDVAVHFWEIAGTRNAVFFHTKCVSQEAWSDPVVSGSDRPHSSVDVAFKAFSIANRQSLSAFCIPTLAPRTTVDVSCVAAITLHQRSLKVSQVLPFHALLIWVHCRGRGTNYFGIFELSHFYLEGSLAQNAFLRDSRALTLHMNSACQDGLLGYAPLLRRRSRCQQKAVLTGWSSLRGGSKRRKEIEMK